MLLCMTACKKESNGILRLEIEHFSSDTKLHLDAAHFAVWDNNDEVLLNSDTKPVTISNGTATISGVATDDNYTAVYPSSWALSKTFITYPEFQFNYNGRVIAPMAATYDGEKLKFKNLGAILAVNVNTPMTVDRIEVIADGTTSISGTFPISYDGTRPTIGTPTSTDGTNTNMTTLICDSVVTNSAIFYIALPPVTAQLTIKVYGDTYCYTKTQNNPLALQANHGYSISLSDNGFITTPMPASNQIFYTTNTNATISLSAIGTIESNEYNATVGQCIATFAQDIPSTLPRVTAFTSCTSITLPASVTTLASSAFSGCSNLKSVIMPGVTTIADHAFNGCSGLKTLSMPKVTSIGGYAFNNCTNLTSVSMPNITSIASRAFTSCGNVRNIYCTRTSYPTTKSNAFGVNQATRLHLPLSKYGSSSWANWGTKPTYFDL